MPTADDIQALGDLPSAQRQDMPFPPGEDNPESWWSEIINMRIERDGRYGFLRKRGGSVLQDSVFGNILTIYPFTATTSPSPTDYVALHTAAGHAYLWEKDGGSPTQMFDSVFSTDRPIAFAHVGIHLYMFDGAGGAYKVYNIASGSGHDWLSSHSAPLSGISWITGDFTEDNVWGFEEDAPLGVFHNHMDGGYKDDAGNPSYKSFSTKIESVKAASLIYEDPGGRERSTGVGSVGIFPATPDLEDLVGRPSAIQNPSEKFVGRVEAIAIDDSTERSLSLNIAGAKVPETGVIDVDTTWTTTDLANEIKAQMRAHPNVSANWSITSNGAIVTLESKHVASLFDEDAGFSVTYHGDQGTLDVYTADPHIPDSPSANAEYRHPVLYRSYLVVDVLSDGSYLLPGRPATIATSIAEIQSAGRIGVDLTLPAGSAPTSGRYLFATRWQYSRPRAHDPSSESYPNSPYFLAAQLEPGQTSARDFTPDRKLNESLSSPLPMAAGTPLLFGAGQLAPASATSVESALLLGGYKINRPTPAHYTDAANAGGGNCYFPAPSGSSIGWELRLMFEYPNGDPSAIEATGVDLTDGTETVIPGTSATAPECWTYVDGDPKAVSGSPSSATLDVTFKDVTEEVTVNLSDSALQLANRIASEVNGNGSFPASASVSTDHFGEDKPQIIFTSDTDGTADNDESVTLQLQPQSPPDALTVDISPSSPTMSGGTDGSPAVTVSANQLQIHSLNSLVSQVYVLGHSPGTYKLLGSFGPGDGEFHGQTIFLPNSGSEVSAAETFSVPSGASEAVDLPGHVLPAGPFQQLRITDQKPAQDRAPIKQMVPLAYDPDKTLMRMRVAVFTEQGLQTGYFSFTETDQIQASFEVTAEGVTLAHDFGAHRAGGDIIFQAEDGIYAYPGGPQGKILDQGAYEVASSQLRSAFLNPRWGEVWMIFAASENTAIVFDPAEGGALRRITFPSSRSLRSGSYFKGDLMIGLSERLYYTDVDGVHTDAGTPVEGTLRSRHIGSPLSQARILEVNIFGQGYTVQTAVDTQPERLEGSAGTWSEDFSADVTEGPDTLSQGGVSHQIQARGVMPRIQLTFGGSAEGFASRAYMKYIELSNAGIARRGL